jgi:hypothetical protein
MQMVDFRFSFTTMLDQLSISELEKFLDGIQAGLQRKEIYTIIKILDIDNNKFVSREEFIFQMEKAEIIWKERFIKNEEVGIQKRKDDPQVKSNLIYEKHTDKFDNEIAQSIITKMEEQSFNVTEFLQLIENKTGNFLYLSFFIRKS